MVVSFFLSMTNRTRSFCISSFISLIKSNRSKEPHKVLLAAHEREKKKKYLGACLERRHFSPFVVSTDGLLGKDAKILLKKLSARLAKKWEKPYSEVCGYVNARMSTLPSSELPSTSVSVDLVIR
jgi:hypothetical protein